MKKPYGFKCINWILVFSIFNLQFSSLAYGGRDPDGLRRETSGGHLGRPLLGGRDCAYDQHGKENQRPEALVKVCIEPDPDPQQRPSLPLERSTGQKQERRQGVEGAGLLLKSGEHDYPNGAHGYAPPPSRSEAPLKVFGEIFTPQDTNDPMLLRTNTDSKILERARGVFASILKMQDFDPNFGRVFHTFHYDMHKEETSLKTHTAIRIAEVVIAPWASGARAILFLTTEGVGAFIVGAPFSFPPFPRPIAIGAGCAGALSWPDNYLFLQEVFSNATRFFQSPHAAIIEDFSMGKVAALITFALPRIIGFGIQTFVYVNTIIRAPLGVVIFAVPAGGAYLAVCLGQAYVGTLEGWPRVLDIYEQLWRGMQRTFCKPQTLLPQEVSLNNDTIKRDIRVHLAQGKRKALANPAEALALYEYIEATSQEVAEVRTQLQKSLETLMADYEVLPEKTPAAQDTYEARKADLQNQLERVQWVGDLLILQAYYDFDKERSHPVGSGHPLFYKFAQGIGAVLGGMASVSVWYAIAFMCNSLGISREKTIGMAALATIITVPSLALNSAKAFSGFASDVKGYHPIANTPTIEGHTVIRPSGLRNVIAISNMAKSVYLALPTSLLGPRGMVQNGIWPGAPRIGPEGIPTTWTNIAVWGLVEHNETEARLQERVPKVVQAIKNKASAVGSWVKRRFGGAKIVNEGEALLDAEEQMQDRFPQASEEDLATKAHKQFGEGEDFQVNLQQHLVTQYERIDNWLRRLNREQIRLLGHYLRTPAEEWFISGRYTPPTPPEPVVLRNP